MSYGFLCRGGPPRRIMPPGSRRVSGGQPAMAGCNRHIELSTPDVPGYTAFYFSTSLPRRIRRTQDPPLEDRGKAWHLSKPMLLFTVRASHQLGDYLRPASPFTVRASRSGGESRTTAQHPINSACVIFIVPGMLTRGRGRPCPRACGYGLIKADTFSVERRQAWPSA